MVDGRRAYGSIRDFGNGSIWDFWYLECREGFEIEGTQVETNISHRAGGCNTLHGKSLALPRQRSGVLDPAIPRKEPGEIDAPRVPGDREIEGGDVALPHRVPLGEGEEAGENAAQVRLVADEGDPPFGGAFVQHGTQLR